MSARSIAAMLGLMLALPAGAQATVRITQLSYPVDLADTPDLRRALSAASTVREGGRTFHSDTRWTVRWHTFWRSAGGQCAMQRVSTEVDIAYTFPQATRLPRRAELRQRYADYLTALQVHEQGHADLAVQAAERIEAALMAVPPQPDCDTLSETANRRGHAILDHTRARERTYDATTGHGRTQGAHLD
ncbi:DUF922 domain-containing protein [Denitromonas iodatirespirans]|uniref:DUF922 domain-containing protein n=1 Tax=Denitromonas iodatirespirans TaxID=2795389 RepID=A0A944D8M3_DENI1|nr:DUF922 domain-containing protein [Denitromonas iodatirespirans]MBT0960043.1 DUF922 domain-containing protein [Denitromonas iodatirespirans]